MTEPLAELVESSANDEGAAPVARVELRAYLRGVGMWTPAHADFDAWVAAGMPEDLHVEDPAGAPSRPPASLLHPRLRRRTSTLTRAAVSALEAATGQGGAALDAVRFVLVSSFGEIETTVALLAQLGEPEGPISPTKFHNSVHNTATGYLSIASGNHREATALAGGPHNLEIGLLEALAGLAEVGGDVVLIFAEELLPAPFTRADADPTFAVALHLSSAPPDPSEPAQAHSLELELCVANRPARVGEGSGPAPGEAGLPSMVPPLVELLRAVAVAGSGALATKRPIPLASTHDPAQASEWSATLTSV
ncbi:beta-ketoacyl synthase chain length factor [Enhygromyxa salina]|uniref:beta-ketoacyl synthase chain length factor n=1 Tax=Enhygromyxa salina TaxID=215803 RepID=UPI0015E60BF0|nr:beta-ketoacyl synthase chain length factor [Enhygromyxa salina]